MENREIFTQVTHPALALIAARPAFFARHGRVVATWQHQNGRVFGPYYRLGFYDAGRQRWIYLGRDDPLVDAVRQALAQLQQPLERHRAYDRTRKKLLAAMRQHKVRLDANLRLIGLRLQGFEVRGWRKTPHKSR